MAQQNDKNKFTPYILVTIAYILAVMFVLQGEPTNVGSRGMIVFIWVISMGVTSIAKNIDNI